MNEVEPRMSKLPKYLWRDIILHSGIKSQTYLEPCVCRDNVRRGPVGGVCGNCGNAIPTQKENDAAKV